MRCLNVKSADELSFLTSFRCAAFFVGILALLFSVSLPGFAQTQTSYWSQTAGPIGTTAGSQAGSGYITPNDGSPAATITAGSGTASTDSTGTANIRTVNSYYRVTLTWQPKNSSFILDPAPSYVTLAFKRSIHVETGVSATTIFLDQNTTPAACTWPHPCERPWWSDCHLPEFSRGSHSNRYKFGTSFLGTGR